MPNATSDFEDRTPRYTIPVFFALMLLLSSLTLMQPGQPGGDGMLADGLLVHFIKGAPV